MLTTKDRNQPTCNINYLGIGLGFMRIIVVPLIVMHRDIGLCVLEMGGLRRRKIIKSVEISIPFIHPLAGQNNSAERWQLPVRGCDTVIPQRRQ